MLLLRRSVWTWDHNESRFDIAIAKGIVNGTLGSHMLPCIEQGLLLEPDAANKRLHKLTYLRFLQ